MSTTTDIHIYMNKYFHESSFYNEDSLALSTFDLTDLRLVHMIFSVTKAHAQGPD